MKQRQFFIICSFGQSGTRWLSDALCKHPSIRAVHGTTMIESDGFGTSIADTEYDPTILKERMFKHSNHSVCGVIHRHAVSTLMPYSSFLSTTSAPLVSVRHPISRLISQYNSYKVVYQGRNQFIPMLSSYLEQNREEFSGICQKFNLDETDPYTKLFFATVKTLHLHFSEVFLTIHHLNQGWETLMPMERFTKDPDYFSWIVDWVSNGTVRIDHDYLNSVFASENRPDPRNNYSHTISLGEKLYSSATERFMMLEPWKQELIARELDPKLSKIPMLYKKLGYSFEMLK